MKRIAILTLAALTGCANPMYYAADSSPDGKRPDGAAAATMRGAWGDDLEGWSVGSAGNEPSTNAGSNTPNGSAMQYPNSTLGHPGYEAAAPGARELGWGQVAPGDRGSVPSGSARTVPPGSSGADDNWSNGTPTIDVQRGASGTVLGQDPGTVAVLNEPPRTTDPSSSRTQLFEQFQRIEEDRDALRQQVAAMQVEFERMQEQVRQHTALRESAAVQSSAQNAQVERLEEQVRQLLLENDDLAGRLLTAQIRRLEAEKALLENWIAAEGVRSRAATPPAVAPPATTSGSGTASAGSGGAIPQ